MIYSLDEALNKPQIPRDWETQAVVGHGRVIRFLLEQCLAFARARKRPCVLGLDGYLAVNWDKIATGVRKNARDLGASEKLIETASCLRSEAEIEALVNACLDKDRFFGSVYRGKLLDFFDLQKLRQLRSRLESLKAEKSSGVVICLGPGAMLPALASCYDFAAYLDTTRETVARRMQGKESLLLGMRHDAVPERSLLRRLSYVDIGVFNKHKRTVLPKVHWYIDSNDDTHLKLVPTVIYEGLLMALSQVPFRLKPVYLPGVWGGQYMKTLRNLPREMVNCSFSLEVVPQFQSFRVAIGDVDLDIPFTNLLWSQPLKVLGQKSFNKFGHYFPISHNYDDTCHGGDLAIQVHPGSLYLRRNFNERLRRDETYYVVASCDGAKTYHGLKEDADVEELRLLAARAEQKKIPFDHDRYIHSWPSKRGDLFLIPAGTVHASGANQLVLEIDSDPGWTGQEYTFHIYDYMRTDLDGKLRDLHIEHAFAVLRRNRRANYTGRHLKQKPKLVRRGSRWAEYSLGDCPYLYYKIHRLEFSRTMEDETRDLFHVLTLTEGKSVVVGASGDSSKQLTIKFTETLIVPACVGRYSLINRGQKPCQVIKSFLR